MDDVLEDLRRMDVRDTLRWQWTVEKMLAARATFGCIAEKEEDNYPISFHRETLRMRY